MRVSIRSAGTGRRRRGFTLLEIALVMIGLAAVTLIGTTIVLGALRIGGVSSEFTDRQIRQAAIADRFRSDVAEAAVAPDRVESFQASPNCLILGKSDGCLVVYRASPQGLERAELNAAGQFSLAEFIAPAEMSVEFSRTHGPRPVITLKLIDARDLKTRKRGLTFSAALGGDLR